MLIRYVRYADITSVVDIVACHTIWLFVLRGLLLVWKVVMELFGRFHVLIAGTELV